MLTGVTAGATHTCFTDQYTSVICTGDESGGATFVMPAPNPSGLVGVFNGNRYGGGG